VVPFQYVQQTRFITVVEKFIMLAESAFRFPC